MSIKQVIEVWWYVGCLCVWRCGKIRAEMWNFDVFYFIKLYVSEIGVVDGPSLMQKPVFMYTCVICSYFYIVISMSFLISAMFCNNKFYQHDMLHEFYESSYKEIHVKWVITEKIVMIQWDSFNLRRNWSLTCFITYLIIIFLYFDEFSFVSLLQ